MIDNFYFGLILLLCTAYHIGHSSCCYCRYHPACVLDFTKDSRKDKSMNRSYTRLGKELTVMFIKLVILILVRLSLWRRYDLIIWSLKVFGLWHERFKCYADLIIQMLWNWRVWLLLGCLAVCILFSSTWNMILLDLLHALGSSSLNHRFLNASQLISILHFIFSSSILGLHWYMHIPAFLNFFEG